MIVTVTANPALDITYTLDHLRLGQSHRPLSQRAVAGGKGINVASVLRCFGYDCAAVGLLGGRTGDAIRADLAARGMDPAHFVPAPGSTRRTVNIVSDGVSTLVNEAGPTVDEQSWGRLERHVRELLARPGAHVLVIAGSLPPGLGEDVYARLVGIAGPDVPTVVDAVGAPLLRACSTGATLVKPNRAELAASTGRDDLLAGAHDLRRRGADNVVVTDGADGVVFVPEDGPSYRARLDAPLAGNPTGAGDAFAAAAATGLLDGSDPIALLRRGVAWSAAAVLAPVAGQVDPERAAELLAHVRIEEIA
ncbi:MAG: hexose kinase [Actinobacteria bacterium]|nr:hexose kinase [Actinomycetota bacterium]